MRRGPIWLWAFSAALVLLGISAPDVALAFNENVPFATGGCGGTCHSPSAPRINEANCAGCHTFAPDNTNSPPDADTDPDFPFLGEFSQRGPHGVYKTTTSRCPMCHTLHDATTGFKLLPGATITATCFSCHDGTGGYGVFGTIAARGLTVGGGHSVDATKTVPGGDAASGGSATRTFRGPSGTMSCSDCHSPHDSNTVQAFTGERLRLRAVMSPVYSTKLLKKQPTGAPSPIDYYGSDWCAGCHQGRSSGGAVHNHPVETRATRPADFYYYNRLAVYRTAGFPTDGQYENGDLTALTNANATIGAIGNIMVRGPSSVNHPITSSPFWYEREYHSSPWLMAYPRSAVHAGHNPICQQCHEDTRECGELSSDGATVRIIRDGVYAPDADGLPPSWTFVSNPRFQNFPHETENPNLLIETGDDLCLNCHPTGVLP